MTLLTEPTRIVLAKGQPVPNDPNFAFNSLLLHGNGTNGNGTNGNGTNENGKSIGASISFVEQTATAVAGIGASTLAVDGNVSIKAHTDERHFLITPSSGNGKGLGFNGVLAILNSESLTHASLSNQAHVSTTGLDVLAEFMCSSVEC